MHAPIIGRRNARVGPVLAGLVFILIVGTPGVVRADERPIMAPLSAAAEPTLIAQAAHKAGRAANVQGDLDALIKAAKAEGEVTFYITLVESVAKRVGDAFTAKYGIKYQFVRLSTGPLVQRYFAEAETGNIAADLVFVSGPATAYTVDGVKRGWIEPLAQAGLPVLRSGEFPARFNKGDTVVIQVAPWLLGYNTQKVKASEAPKDLKDLLNPKWKGQIQVSDPRVGTTIAEFWSLMLDKYGESFFTQFRAQNPRLYPGGAQSIQALGAGEGGIMVPVNPSQLQGVKDKGAPLDTVRLELTTGIETTVVLTSRARAKRPAAARLLANYVMSPDGNKVLNTEPGLFSIYESGGLPSQYEPPNPTAAGRADQFAKLLGFQ